MRAFLLREGDRIRVVTPYVPEFVADLKDEIPYYAKSFDRVLERRAKGASA